MLESLSGHDDSLGADRFVSRQGIVQRIDFDGGAEALAHRRLTLIIDGQIDRNVKSHGAGIVGRIIPAKAMQPETGFVRQIGGRLPAFQAAGQEAQQIVGQGFRPEREAVCGCEVGHYGSEQDFSINGKQ